MKYSRQRSTILEIVQNSYDHPTAEEVYIKAQKKIPSLGIATVYRNLNQLSESGDIIRISQPGGVDRYDGQLEEHYHMRCMCCGELTDLYPTDAEELEELRKFACRVFRVRQKGIGLSDMLLEGVCKNCSKARN